MNDTDFTKIISEKTGLPPKEVKNIIRNLNFILARELKAGKKIRIPGFGNFSRLELGPRKIIDPRDHSKTISLPAQKTVSFRPGIGFRTKSATSLVPKTTILEPIQENKLTTASRPVHIPYIDLGDKVIAKNILNYIPEQMARKYQIMPVEIKDNKLILAMIDPEDQEALEFVKKKIGLAVEPRICTQSDLNNALDQYSGLTSEVEEIVKNEEEIEVKKEKKEKAPKSEEIAGGAPAAKIVSSLIKRAVRDRASDIHIEPEEEDVVVRFRVDGVLKKIIILPKNVQNAVSSRIKILANLRIDETRLPQDGRFRTIIDQDEVDFRVSVLPNVNGEKVVMRILDKAKGLLTLEQLGLKGFGFKVLEENIKKTHGMILVTGPTGSGKTTTLYAVIQKIMNEGINIVTLEDPVEYRIKGINQSPVRADIGFTFANGLRSIVRQDPDIIMIGEIRDFETADMAIHAALTGHVVLSTLHTNNAAGAIPRLIDMKIEPFLISSTINIIIAQRLARKICDKCREEISIPAEQLELVKKIIFGCKELEGKKIKFFHGKGCEVCANTGYKGRIGLFEILNVNETIKNLTNQRTSSEIIQKQAEKDGMTNLKQDGINKAIDGFTTLEEVWRVTKD